MNEPLLTCFTKAALKHARAHDIPARLIPLKQWEREELDPTRVPPDNPVVQEGAVVAVPPGSAVVRGVLPYIRETSTTPEEEATAKADTPFARQEAGSGDPPMPIAPKTKRKTKKPITGRSADGPACISCYYYTALYRNGALYSYGSCQAREQLHTAASNRSPCALYEYFNRRN
jgi:hypothetical protein